MSNLDKQELESIKFIVIEVIKDYITIITNYQ